MGKKIENCINGKNHSWAYVYSLDNLNHLQLCLCKKCKTFSIQYFGTIKKIFYSMKLITYKINDIKVLKLVGEIEAKRVQNLFSAISQLTKNDATVVFDLSAVQINTFVITAFTKLNNSSNKTIIIYVEDNEQILEVLKVIGFTQIFTVIKDRNTLELLCKGIQK